ncbi:cellulose synthase complex periplasmic endoglucanase BcsZ [Dyella sp. C9]|uniref:cellulose synthase complex periplasmic endoglucanase BcsZ n=1 Tax=Dyella sp. C9 TaxID=2202154 RepID=UPI000DEFA63A|nr:cellulose synthase complex periplasmic endoglucanase BcsZ [Dyella sp. C9]
MRRALIPRLIGLIASAMVLCSQGALAETCAWPAWDAFKQGMLSADGRVIDASSPQQVTVSEGQSYALFFALVANDRATFDKVLDWTQDNLAQGDLTTHLPAWEWGRRPATGVANSSTSATPPDRQAWGVLDSASASDSDVWIAYTLLEAGRLWRERRYVALGTVMMRNIAARETASLPGLGRTLLPGPVGFKPSEGVWRLNPSYVPLQVMRRLAGSEGAAASWQALLHSSIRLVTETAPQGYSPDWVEYRADGGFRPDAASNAEGAYNAIRVYLWAGMLSTDDPARATLLPVFRPLADFVAAHGYPPERVDTRTGTVGPNEGNLGFSAAVAPYLAALGRNDLATAQVQRAHALAQQAPPGYYSSVLALFGLGYLDQQYRFDANGFVIPAWTTTCPAH